MLPLQVNVLALVAASLMVSGSPIGERAAPDNTVSFKHSDQLKERHLKC